jgi:hypothetical protein
MKLLILLASTLLAFGSCTNSTLKCQAKVLPCANKGQGCSRPRSLFFLKIRGNGGKMLGEGVFNHVFERENMTIVEGWSMSHSLTAAKLRLRESQGNVVRLTVLRHPIARIVSRYWFEGRWQLFATERKDENAMSFDMWTSRDMCSPDSPQARGGRLWHCLGKSREIFA